MRWGRCGVAAQALSLSLHSATPSVCHLSLSRAVTAVIIIVIPPTPLHSDRPDLDFSAEPEAEPEPQKKKHEILYEKYDDDSIMSLNKNPDDGICQKWSKHKLHAICGIGSPAAETLSRGAPRVTTVSSDTVGPKLGTVAPRPCATDSMLFFVFPKDETSLLVGVPVTMLTLPFVRTFGEVREQVTTQGQWAPKRVTRSNGKITRMQCVGVVQPYGTGLDCTRQEILQNTTLTSKPGRDDLRETVSSCAERWDLT